MGKNNGRRNGQITKQLRKKRLPELQVILADAAQKTRETDVFGWVTKMTCGLGSIGIETVCEFLIEAQNINRFSKEQDMEEITMVAGQRMCHCIAKWAVFQDEENPDERGFTGVTTDCSDIKKWKAATLKDIKPPKPPKSPTLEIEETCLWIGDTGASSHMTNVWQRYTHVFQDRSKTNFGKVGSDAIGQYAGSWLGRQYHQGKVHKQVTKGKKIALENVLYIPELRNNLFSINQEIKKEQKSRMKDQS